MTAPKPKTPRACKTCGDVFAPNDPKSIYCSVKCRTNNPDKSKTTQAYQQRRRALLNEYKLQMGCARCGYKEHAAALHFNHLGDKSFNISQDPKRAWAAMFSEIEKCEVLCANCHSVHSYENKHFHTKRKARAA